MYDCKVKEVYVIKPLQIAEESGNWRIRLQLNGFHVEK